MLQLALQGGSNMTRLQHLLLAALIILAPAALAQSGAAAPASPYWDALVKDAKTRIREIAPADLAALQKSETSLVMVDVREDSEWEEAHAAGAKHVSRGVLEPRISAAVPAKDTPVAVYCRSGARSAVAADTLGKMGYTKVYSVAGGFMAYEKAGLPVERGKPAK